jgi:hypothetical protein
MPNLIMKAPMTSTHSPRTRSLRRLLLTVSAAAAVGFSMAATPVSAQTTPSYAITSAEPPVVGPSGELIAASSFATASASVTASGSAAPVSLPPTPVETAVFGVTTATQNGWLVAMGTPAVAPSSTTTTDFYVNLTHLGSAPSTVYLEQGWYWFGTPQLVECRAVGASCSSVSMSRDASADGVANAIVIQGISIPSTSVGQSVTLRFRVPAGSDARCAFYAGAYQETPTPAALVTPPPVRNFGCRP